MHIRNFASKENLRMNNKRKTSIDSPERDREALRSEGFQKNELRKITKPSHKHKKGNHITFEVTLHFMK